ncbi:type 1 fimbrial protein (plasmid) [Lelliottia sp. WB101]|uniref:fimbrial protein n=1 Tax=Lelliottia sp. WB101 TaxID=2153385 RepID=UPI000D205727|nr:fimbrial protein [Lelliottia sp. WB101]AVZ00439.1 type 1 fimbrial protein [Lelliottia sp. WB101]
MRTPLVLMSLLIYSAYAVSDTDVVFDGVLISEPCNISTDSEEQLVDFRNIPAKTFLSNDRTAPEKFSILLKECDISIGKTVSVSFQGTESLSQPGNFATEGDAKGISIALEDAKGRAIHPNEPAIPVSLNEGDTALEYQAYVQASDYTSLEYGDFTSSVTFSFEYE